MKSAILLVALLALGGSAAARGLSTFEEKKAALAGAGAATAAQLEAGVSAKKAFISGAVDKVEEGADALKAAVSAKVSAKKEAIEDASELFAAKISAKKEAIAAVPELIAAQVSAKKALVSAAKAAALGGLELGAATAADVKADVLKPELWAKPAQPLAQGLPTKP